MSRLIKSDDRFQSILFPETLDDYIEEDNSVRVIEALLKRWIYPCLGSKKLHLAPPSRLRPCHVIKNICVRLP